MTQEDVKVAYNIEESVLYAMMNPIFVYTLIDPSAIHSYITSKFMGKNL